MTIPSDPNEIIRRDHKLGGKPALGAFLPVEKRMANADAIARRRARAGTGAGILDDLADALARYVAFPSPAARDATALWAAHTHCLDAFESTPRLAPLSPEKGSGKTRLLEVLDRLVPHSAHPVNMTPAALFRLVAGSQATVLMDECDTYFGPRSAKDHEELRGLVNAGHRRGAVAYRCVGPQQEVRAFPAYAAVALAGIGDLPDTILDRSIVIKMRRRAPHETIEPFRQRHAGPVLAELRERLAAWTKTVTDELADTEPEMPPGLTDRPADVWEPLIAIGDVAGGAWPARARAAAVELNAARQAADPSLGVRLLADLRQVFAVTDRLWTEDILAVLTKMEEAPWGELRGKPLDARGLAQRLRRYDVRPTTIRIGENLKKGYRAEDLYDAWCRYLPPDPENSVTSGTAVTTAGQSTCPPVTANGLVTDRSVTASAAGTERDAVTSTCNAVPDVTLPGRSEGEVDVADRFANIDEDLW